MSEHEEHVDHSAHYKKIFKWLVIAFLISFIGPFIGEAIGEHGGETFGPMGIWLTLITAFGVALFKARLVIVHFMHLPHSKPYISYIVQTALVLMAIFVAGVMVDVMNHEGDNWENIAAKQIVQDGLEAMKATEGDH